jgi:hypothetical protein
MENTINPLYKVSVTFNWHYADNSVRKIQKSDFVSHSGTEEEIAESFIKSFIDRYTIGICRVENMHIHLVKRIFTIDDWIEKYNPIKNHINEDRPYDGLSFETYDEEIDFVSSQNPCNIWTLVYAKDEYYIVPGFRWMDRECYFISEKPFTDENLHEEYLVI